MCGKYSVKKIYIVVILFKRNNIYIIRNKEICCKEM